MTLLRSLIRKVACRFRLHVRVLGRIYGALAILAFTGCAATPSDMAETTDAPGNVVFTLEEGLQIRGGSQSIHLAQGNYRIVRRNAHGAMYAAPGFGVIRPSSRGYLGYQGGLWVPRNRLENVRIYVLYETSERLYSDLQSALTLPAEAERKLLEATVAGEIRPAAEPPVFHGGNIATSPAAQIVMAIAESQRGKPDVIAELPRTEFERMLAAVTTGRQ